MTWIRFELAETALPDLDALLLRAGKPPLVGLNASSSRVVFFAHGWSCDFCRGLMHELSAVSGNLDASLLVVVPSQDDLPADVPPGLHFLVDPQTRYWREYAKIFEFELPGELMLFVLNQYIVPVRAWVGAEASPGDMIGKIGQALDFIEIQCPE
jgi:hypothetical protein